ncbi:dipeptide ABC transporter ATP-binding protein [Jannaschia seohaensis]|uniref:Peptide/nickel transport system ATP-binding protein n=1 Tax=Jannaschia seohaensis TaxID=475081 RepID=A0A2Y9B3S5_9RHOB|nr:ABC transporter ATP-binding protein [Jannaschia seohaensis]PWJ15894.1 peptide/nickel transport system ATP-binding protein [Jannaschia seohaensis]SSA49607.1 peptide/nickel transport system ATP-binding protein [Jannaschia seohaensis]
MAENLSGAPAPLLSIRGLTVGLPADGDRPEAVSEVSFDIAPGETVCLVGESGSGKSVIGQAILGMLPHALPVLSGEVHLDDAPLPPQRDPAYGAIRSAQVAMIFQDAAASLNPVRTIGAQLAEVLEVHGVPKRDRKARVLDVLRAVALPEPERIAKSYPHQLSGGQAQRAVIAGALLLEPKLLIADEPTTALDVTTQAEILALIARLKAEHGLSVLFVTHDFGVVAEIADRVVVMEKGVQVETGRAAAVLHAPQHPYTKKLIAAVTPAPRERETGGTDTILEATDIDLTYRGGLFGGRKALHAVKGASLRIEAGRTVAVVGESGSGKSSLARCLLRLEEIDSGSIRFKGEEISKLTGKPLQHLRKSLQVVLQDPYSALDPRQTIRAAIAEGPIIHGTPKVEAHAQAAELLELVGLPAQAGGRYPQEFSGGQRQRICIARALALKPDLLIADEAVSALDVSIQAQILDLFADMQKRFGFAILFITHDLAVARAIADDILVMRRGEIVERGPAAQVFASPAHPYTADLLAAAPGLDMFAKGDAA